MNLVLCMLLTSFHSRAQKNDLFRQELNEVMEKYQTVGLAFAVVKDNKIVYQEAIGNKNLERKEDLKIDNLFRIASISKSFTATALMQLVDQKKISLDDDFGDLIGFPIRNPKFPNTVITLRMILSHTSSINDKNGYFELDVIHPTKNKSWEKSYNDYEPGTSYQYCNLNFNMAGAVLERLTNIRFDKYIHQQIIAPLKLNAGYNIDALDSSAFATIYDFNRSENKFIPQPAAYLSRKQAFKNYRIGESTPIFSPTGGMKISAPDLAKYMIMHMNYGRAEKTRILSKKSAQEMQKPVAIAKGYGLALHEKLDILENIRLIGHTGSAYGLYSSMFFHPEEKYGFVVITNGCIPIYEGENLLLTKSVIQLLHRYYIE